MYTVPKPRQYGAFSIQTTISVRYFSNVEVLKYGQRIRRRIVLLYILYIWKIGYNVLFIVYAELPKISKWCLLCLFGLHT
jgi:hypothetical protein